MDTSLAVKLASTLKKGSLHAAVVNTPDGDRIEFEGGAFGGHGIWLSCSSEERILAHWDGYCSGQPAAPAADALVEYVAIVEGSYIENDGWSKTRTGCVGWCLVRARKGATMREIAGLVRGQQERIEWEVDYAEVRYLRTTGLEGKS